MYACTYIISTKDIHATHNHSITPFGAHSHVRTHDTTQSTEAQKYIGEQTLRSISKVANGLICLTRLAVSDFV